jgi:hypothetical protein
MPIGSETLLIPTTARIIPPLLITTIILVAVVIASTSLINPIATVPILLFVTLAAVHAGCATGLSMHIIRPKPSFAALP